MIRNRLRTTPSQSYILIITLLLSFVFNASSLCQASQQNTAFLPFKINSVSNSPEMAAEADAALFQALMDENVSPISRETASRLADYKAVWPPANSVLEKVTNSTGFANVAAGTITVIGNRLSIDIKVVDTLSPSTPVYFYRHAIERSALKNGIDDIVIEVLTYTDREHRIATITPEGNKRVDSGAILRKIQTKTGDIYNPAILREDLKAIYAMGYFNDVQIDLQDSDKGKVVTFRVVEKPIISSVVFEGQSELKEEEVRAAANIKEYHILNPTQITTGKEALLALYESKGYYNCTIETEISYPSESGAVVTFNIDEGDKIYIEEITLEGNNSFDADDILDQIESKEKGWLTWLTADGLLDMDKIRQDADRIVAFYNNSGFLDARVGEPVVTQEEDSILLHFIIEEGPRYRVGTVDFAGDLVVDKKVLARKVTVRTEPYLNRQILREDILSITDVYSELGYAFASIRPKTAKSATGDRIDITFQIDKGELVYIDRIIISGNSRTRDNVIRRELRIVEGGIFDSAALRRSNQALQRLSYFEEINITPEPTSDPTRMNIVISVKEKPTGTFSIGAGYSSSDGAILTGSISENNFLGRGDTLSFSAEVGGSSARYNLGYTDPRLNDSQLSWGVDLYNTETEYDDYDKDTMGAGIRIGYPIWEKWRLFANYSLSNTELSDIDDDASQVIILSEDINITSAIKATLVRDTRDKTFMATRGSRTELSAKYAGGLLMGDASFTKFEGSSSWYFPMPLDLVFHAKGAAGYVVENESGMLPVYDRFFLGGIKNMRGFEFADMSPTLEGDKIGGNIMWYTNWELIFPISDAQGVKGMLFTDIGEVTDEDDLADTSYGVQQSVGLGLAWNSPMGPLILVWGYNLDPQGDQEASVFDFSMGGNF